MEPFWRVKIRNKIAIPKTFSDTVPLKCKFRFRWITISVARPASATGTPHSASRRRDSLKVTRSHSFFSHSLFYLFLCIFSLHINLTPFVSLDLFQTLLLSLSHFLFFSHSLSLFPSLTFSLSPSLPLSLSPSPSLVLFTFFSIVVKLFHSISTVFS